MPQVTIYLNNDTLKKLKALEKDGIIGGRSSYFRDKINDEHDITLKNISIKDKAIIDIIEHLMIQLSDKDLLLILHNAFIGCKDIIMSDQEGRY